MKKILMITPFFAPYSHAAVYRAHRFAKYLPRFGWKPYALTVDRSSLYFIDTALLDDLPKEVEIIRARHIDLTFFGLKSLFEKPITNSRAIRGPTSSELTAKLQKGEKKNFVKSIMDKFRDKILFLPDRYITWYPFAFKKAKEIINSERIDVIYSTAFPLTAHLIAMKLRKKFKIPWIADFREGEVEVERTGYSSSRFKYKISSILERKIMREADLVLTAWEDAKDLFLVKYKGIVNNKITCISHCTDTEILQSAELKEKSKKFTIIFVGEFLHEYSWKFFEILRMIFEERLFERNRVEVLIIGCIKRNIFIKKEIEFLGLEDVVRLVDYLSLKDYFSVLLSADAMLLPCVLKYSPPLKLFDYLFAKKPIIILDTTEEVRNILEKSGLGIFIPSEINAGVEVLLGLLRRNYNFNANEDYINQFNAFNRTKELSSLLEALIEKNK